MAPHLKIMLLTCMLLAGISRNIKAQTTTVWIVRHAEKDTTNAKETDVPLSAEGSKRAEDLAAFLIKKRPVVIFSTPYKRTIQTADPLVKKYGTELKIYKPAAIKPVAASILNQYAGKTILIVGHSNTVLETIEALGGQRPLPELTDDDYDYLFKVTRHKNGSVRTQVLRFGALHHHTAGNSKMMMQMN